MPLLRKTLDEAYDRLKEVYVGTSALGPVRAYSGSDEDREFWALYCALLDFQVPVVGWLNPLLNSLRLRIEEEGVGFSNLFYDEMLATRVLEGFK